MEKQKSIHLQIEHKVPNFDGWKKAFESDPINRKKSGVRNYQIFRPVDDPNYVIVDLVFDNLKQAEDTLVELRKLWTTVEGKIMMNPQTRILDLIEVDEI
ncbi:MAG TPA: hypothetical protein VK666_12070 [Chryseolinea sp.]|nr:hypothetical protein [Chryseolinea sp.]